jgi:uncharacterized protein (TIGR03435 family)
MTMLQNLLIQRFKLAYHYQKKQSDEYSLVVGKNGHKLTVSPLAACGNSQKTCDLVNVLGVYTAWPWEPASNGSDRKISG